MEDQFSQSLTPPVSPFMVEEFGGSSLVQLPCFSCALERGRDEVQGLSSNSYISRGVLKRLLLNLDPAPAEFESEMLDLFGISWVTETTLLESTQLLFGLFRQNFFKLETLVKSSSHDFGKASSLHYEAEELRQQCVRFLTYVKVFVHRFVEVSRAKGEENFRPAAEMEEQFPSVLLLELFGLKLLVGRIRDLPANVQSSFSIQHQGKLFSPSWHLLHLHLDVHWALLEILHILGHKLMGQVVYGRQFVDLTGETLTDISLFEDHLNNLLCDLTSLSIDTYRRVRPTEALITHHYQCVCTKELWILLLHLLEHRSKTLHTQSFWGYVNDLLTLVLKGTPSALTPHCKDTLGFTWWFITHLTQLSMYNHNGALHKKAQLGDNWFFVCELLKSSCDVKAELQEDQMRMYLHCCLSLSMLWESNITAITILWEFYSRNLNRLFTVPWLGLSGVASVSSTPLALLEQAKSCCKPSPLDSEDHAQLYCANSSYLLFLRMLALHLKQQNGSPWRQIKGRIYSKFHERRMAELSESGLHHFLLLFLVLSLCADLEDAAGRALDLLAYQLPAGVTVMSWRGRLALLLVYVERSVDVAGAAGRISSSFSTAAKEFYLKTTPLPRRAELWRLISGYLEGVGEVWQSSATLCLSEERLINEGFSLLLPACSTKELATALDFLQMVLMQLRRVRQLSISDTLGFCGAAPPLNVVKERHLVVAVTLWTHFLPFLRSHRLSQTPSSELAQAAAGFTLLALDLPNSAPEDLQPDPLQYMLQCFGWDEMLCPLFVTRYLNQLLNNEQLVCKMCGGCGSAQSLCVKTWIRCILQQHQRISSSDIPPLSKTDSDVQEQVCKLTRLVLTLPEVQSLFQQAGQNIDTAALKIEPKPALNLFLKSVADVYQSLQVQAKRVSLVCKALEYVGDIMKFIKPNLLKKNAEGLSTTYWVLGYLVKEWSPLLATAKAQPLLLRIVDVLLLPHSLLQDKAPPCQLISALQDTLPLYLQGLSVAVGVAQTQVSYLKQQLRNVISQYLSRFLQASPTLGAIANHPVLLAGREAAPTPQGVALRRSILQVIRENFLHFKGHVPPPRLAAMLMFLSELLRCSNDTDPALLTLPLPSVLRCFMLVNIPQVRKLSIECVQLMVERSSSAASGVCEELISALRCFVEENEGVYEIQMYTALEMVAILSPFAVAALIPVLSMSLRNTEQKRGLGKNSTLRNGYKTVLALLGDAGQTEIIHLEQD